MVDGEVAECLRSLGSIWSTIDLSSPYTEAACERRGDVVEIFMARLRGYGEDELGHVLQDLASKGQQLQTLYSMLSSKPAEGAAREKHMQAIA